MGVSPRQQPAALACHRCSRQCSRFIAGHRPYRCAVPPVAPKAMPRSWVRNVEPGSQQGALPHVRLNVGKCMDQLHHVRRQAWVEPPDQQMQRRHGTRGPYTTPFWHPREVGRSWAQPPPLLAFTYQQRLDTHPGRPGCRDTGTRSHHQHTGVGNGGSQPASGRDAQAVCEHATQTVIWTNACSAIN